MGWCWIYHQRIRAVRWNQICVKRTIFFEPWFGTNISGQIDSPLISYKTRHLNIMKIENNGFICLSFDESFTPIFPFSFSLFSTFALCNSFMFLAFSPLAHYVLHFAPCTSISLTFASSLTKQGEKIQASKVDKIQYSKGPKKIENKVRCFSQYYKYIILHPWEWWLHSKIKWGQKMIIGWRIVKLLRRNDYMRGGR